MRLCDRSIFSLVEARIACVPRKPLFIAMLLKSLWSFVSQDEAHTKRSAGNLQTVQSFSVKLEVFSPSMLGWRWLFSPLEESSVATGRTEIGAPAASSCPEVDAPGVLLVTLSESCWHRFSRLESPAALIFWWKYCVIVHVGILIVSFPHYHCWAMNWLLLRASTCSERFSNVLSCWKMNDSELQKKLANCFE